MGCVLFEGIMLELLDIKTDYIFKLVFGDENDKSILISFLNA